jgi:hypothetical protein
MLSDRRRLGRQARSKTAEVGFEGDARPQRCPGNNMRKGRGKGKG